MRARSNKKAARRQWSGKTDGGNFGQEFLISLLGRVPLRCGYALLDIALPFHLAFNSKRFKATRDYFRERIGDSRGQSFRNAYATHRLFGQMMFDRFRIFSRGVDEFSVSVVGNDGILERMQAGEGFVIAGSHFGSMETAGYMLGLKDKPINAVVFGGETAALQSHRTSILEAHGVKMVPVSEDLSHLFIIKAALEAGEIVSMPCDRLFGSNKYVECDFLGAPARFPVGAFILAAQMGKEVVALFSVKDGPRSYKVFVRPVESGNAGAGIRQTAVELAGKYVEELESMVRKYPRQWFNFYDFWKIDE